jgi:hypothetical protein
VATLTRTIRGAESVATASEYDGRANAFAHVQVFEPVVRALEAVGLCPTESDCTALSVSRGLAILPHRDKAGPHSRTCAASVRMHTTSSASPTALALLL